MPDPTTNKAIGVMLSCQRIADVFNFGFDCAPELPKAVVDLCGCVRGGGAIIEACAQHTPAIVLRAALPASTGAGMENPPTTHTIESRAASTAKENHDAPDTIRHTDSRAVRPAVDESGLRPLTTGATPDLKEKP